MPYQLEIMSGAQRTSFQGQQERAVARGASEVNIQRLPCFKSLMGSSCWALDCHHQLKLSCSSYSLQLFRTIETLHRSCCCLIVKKWSKHKKGIIKFIGQDPLLQCPLLSMLQQEQKHKGACGNEPRQCQHLSVWRRRHCFGCHQEAERHGCLGLDVAALRL